ncbi:Hypothetical Protein FCC1311_107552 [Hondaea fermentalgiana]|uniref:Uncharacterized protein n=1 Tax=Hondaea fermentalgiana TaxID=2315210 RepID=A0A2R5H166_9STRA|nr:Hypothetical Protein FCC1311_107552 [Hondaea fermentalgiana]|eukprot:GBG34531.1 Hypothetical Protein FCC1311_107552 [Hondaea fermentalgiana]
MERSELQREWALHRLDGRTSYATTVGSGKSVDHELATLPGAGRASREVASTRNLLHGGNQAEDALAQLRPEDVDWAGNLVPLNRRKTFASDSKQSTNVRVEDGFLVGQDARTTQRRLSQQQSVHRSSNAVLQASPGGLEPSQWRTSYQDGVSGVSAPTSGRSVQKVERLQENAAAPFGGPIPQGSMAVRPRAVPTFDKEKGDFARGLDTLAIAKSLKRSGLASTRSRASSESKSTGDVVLILQNFKQYMPGTTLYTTHRHWQASGAQRR